MLLERLFSPASSPLANRVLTVTDDEDPDAQAGGGLSSTSDEADPDADSRETEDEAARVAKAESDDDGQNYKKRFADTKADRDRLKARADDLEAENEELRRQGIKEAPVTRQAAAEADEAAIVAQAEREYFGLPKDQQTGTKWATLLVKHTLDATRKVAVETSQRTLSDADSQSARRADAESKAQAALTERGLTSPKALRLFQAEVDEQMRTDPGWFRRTSPSEQYGVLADRVKETVESFTAPDPEHVKAANAERRKEAAGTLPTGTRTAPRRTPSSSGKDTDGESDTMTANLTANRQAARERGAALSGRPA